VALFHKFVDTPINGHPSLFRIDSVHHDFSFPCFVGLLIIRLCINRPTKRGKEKNPSDGHQCEKEMEDHTCVSTIFKREPRSKLAERASFLKINDINDIFLERLTYIVVL
jgi:hypothetical protein